MVATFQCRAVIASVLFALAECTEMSEFDSSISLLQTRAQYERRQEPGQPEAHASASMGDISAVTTPGDHLHYKEVDPQGILKKQEEAAHDVPTLQFLSSFRPCAACKDEAIMVGGTGDGSYTMCGDLLHDVTAAYSYGIEGSDAWGADLSTRLSIPVHQFDCFDTRRPTCPPGDQCNFEFNEECVGQRLGDEEKSGGKHFASLREQLTKRGHAESGNLVMKMDIEGSEWEVLASPDNQNLLPRFSQIILELHLIGSKRFPQHEAMRNLLQHFAVMHIHENNCCGVFDKVPGYNIARVVEISLVRRDLIAEGQCDPDPGQEGTRNKQYQAEVQGAHLPGGSTPGFSASET